MASRCATKRNINSNIGWKESKLSYFMAYFEDFDECLINNQGTRIGLNCWYKFYKEITSNRRTIDSESLNVIIAKTSSTPLCFLLYIHHLEGLRITVLQHYLLYPDRRALRALLYRQETPTFHFQIVLPFFSAHWSNYLFHYLTSSEC